MQPDIDAVSVSVNYADILKYTLPANRAFFRRWVIVTEASDTATIELCTRYGVEMVVTEKLAAARARNAPFAKGLAINDGLSRLAPDGWTLHIDSDILLPQDFDRLADAPRDPEVMYGLRTYICPSNELLRFGGSAAVIRRGEELYPGHCAIGYFQLFHTAAAGFARARRRYPAGSRNADNDDVVFRMCWNGKSAWLNPDGTSAGLHLGTPRVNWGGRTARTF